MGSMSKRWLAAPLVMAFIVAACGEEAAEPTTEPIEAAATEAAEPTEAPEAEPTEEPEAEPTEESEATEASAAEPAEDSAEAPADASGVTAMLGDEEIAIERVLCYFEEQPRAALGGVWTHTLQARGTNPAGEPVIISLDRARSEEGEVTDSVIVDVGDFTAEDAVSLSANGPEGLVEFGDASASAEGVEVSDFGSDPVTLSAQFDCG